MKINSLNNVAFGKLYMGSFYHIDSNAKRQINKFRSEIDKISKKNIVSVETHIDQFNKIYGWSVYMIIKDKNSSVSSYSAFIPKDKGEHIGETVVDVVSKLSTLM